MVQGRLVVLHYKHLMAKGLLKLSLRTSNVAWHVLAYLKVKV